MSKVYGGLLVVAICFIGYYYLIPVIDQYTTPQQEVIDVQPMWSERTATLPEPKRMYGIVVDSMLVIEDKVKRNQNISEILSAHNVSREAIFKLASLSKNVFDVRKLSANKKYTLICDPDSLKTARAFVYEHNPIEYVVFNLNDSITIEKKEKAVETVEKTAAGEITASLSVTMSELGLSPMLTNTIADIFGWQIDFFRLQRGDRFKVIYEDKLVEGVSIGLGNVKGIYFEHFSNGYYAFRYDQGNGFDYFDEKGNSLRKALLKYPLEFTRISSRYSGNRYHPVQKQWKAHRGTDFAAPRGTPIRTVGDGIITEARYTRYNGNYVKVKHNGTYTTQYLHMSKIASGIKPGTRVRQGQTIGYVGSTGLATGNHLCYRFWKNGVQIDALKVELPPSEPIVADKKAAYNLKVKEMVQRLDNIPFPQEQPQILASARE